MKRKPALIAAIKKFNEYCDQLRKIQPLPRDVHLPERLPTDLSLLRDHPSFMQDVWIAPTPGQQPPRWLEDVEVRKGVHAMHKRDRSLEERRRCGSEADNMCCWFGKELMALEIAIHLPESEWPMHKYYRIQPFNSTR